MFQQSTLSSIVEDSLVPIARKNLTTRFVKLHYEIAEMENIHPPALLAYKAGDVFASIVDVTAQLPNGRDLSPASLEDLLKLYVLSLSPRIWQSRVDHTNCNDRYRIL